jgi:hypothetical protein
MTPKEKAKEFMHYYLKELLSAKYSINGFIINDLAKQCALIAVDEINKVYESLDEDADLMFKKELNYWQEVKQEIEKL